MLVLIYKNNLDHLLIFIIIYIVKFYLTFFLSLDTPSVKTVITVIVIAVMQITNRDG